MRRFVIACLAVVALAACSSGDDKPGNAAVYDRIGSLTDCSAVQAEFNAAFDTSERTEGGTDEHEAAVGYMEAANDKLESLGC